MLWECVQLIHSSAHACIICFPFLTVGVFSLGTLSSRSIDIFLLSDIAPQKHNQNIFFFFLLPYISSKDDSCVELECRLILLVDLLLSLRANFTFGLQCKSTMEQNQQHINHIKQSIHFS